MILLDRTVLIMRLSAINSNRTSYATLTTTIEATIQPLGDSDSSMAGGAHGRLYKIFMDVDRDVREDDKIQDRDGNIYKVLAGGVENRNDGFMADYMGITAQKIS